MNDLILDLEAEHLSLELVVDPLSAESWRLPTESPGWTVADQISHLQFFDQRATWALNDVDRFVEDRANLLASAPRDLSVVLGRSVSSEELLVAWKRERSALLAALRSADPTVRVPWYGPSMSVKSFLTARLMECWAHGFDVATATGVDRPSTDRLRHVAHIGVGARAFSLLINGLEADHRSIRVELVSPRGELWTWGDEVSDQRVVGDALDFCRVVTQRSTLALSGLTITGESAVTWMAVAQAFAGAPGKKAPTK